MQACHVAEVHGILYAEDNPWVKKQTPTVLVSVANLQELKLWHRKVNQACIEHVEWTEPDMGGEPTALACRTATNIFDKLPLWTGVFNDDPVY